MKFGAITIPDDLLAAQREGRLVIFAGAGVSRGEPARLPDFKKLAQCLAMGTGEETGEEPDPPYEKFLGRLLSQRPRLRAKLRDILAPPHARPTRLHQAIVRLFGPHTPPRIVTTNFDCLFGELVEARRAPRFVAPALPQGDDFTGLVYLHGCIEDTDHLVLTDGDFGRAYFTQGWARRFMVALFGRFTVLFVGYSGQDTVFHYLTRGLPPGNLESAFALCPTGERDTWIHLGVQPLSPEGSSAEHEEIAVSLDGWGEHANRHLFERQATLERLLGQTPNTLDQEELDLVEDALRDRALVGGFAWPLASAHWLEWADGQRAFEALFSNVEHWTQLEEARAVWLSRALVGDAHTAALRVLLRHEPQRPHARLRTLLLRELADSPQVPAPAVFGRLLVLLLRDEYRRDDEYVMASLLQRVIELQVRECIPLVVDHLTRPRFVVRRRWSLTVDETPPEVQPVLDSDPSANEWARAETLLTSDPHLCRELLSIIEANGRRLDLALRAAEGERASRYDLRESLLERAAVDSLKSLLQLDRVAGGVVVSSWVRSDVPILCELACHSVVASGLGQEEKRACLADAGLSPDEVMAVLDTPSSRVADETLDAGVRARPHIPGLREMSPADVVALGAQPEVRANLGAVVASVAEHPTWPWPVIDILVRDKWWDHSMWPLVFVGFAAAMSDQVPWERVADLLAAHPELDLHAPAIARLFRKLMWPPHKPLTLLHTMSEIAARLIAPLVQHAGEKMEPRPLPDTVDPQDDMRSLGGGPPQDPWIAWTEEHPMAAVVRFIADAAAWEREQAGATCAALPSATGERLLALIEGPDAPGRRVAIATLAQGIPELWLVDATWTGQHLLTLLDWETCSERAAWSWAGLLHRVGARDFGRDDGWLRGGRPGLLEALVPWARQAIAHLNHLKPADRGQLARLVGYAAVFGGGESLVRELVRAADAKVRRGVAREIELALQDSSTDRRATCWERWIMAYWHERAEDNPVRLEPGEVQAMLAWIFPLEARVEEVVEHACECLLPSLGGGDDVARPAPADLMFWSQIVGELRRTWVAKHPAASAQLLEALLPHLPVDHNNRDDWAVLIRGLGDAGVDPDEVKVLCERLAQLGYSPARHLWRDIAERRSHT